MDLGTRDVVVIGGGLVGCAAALGLARSGADVLVLEGPADQARASRGNFGLVWSQSKGARGRDYATWTRRAIADWEALAAEILDLSGIPVHYRHGLGVHLCLSEEEWTKRAALISRVAAYGFPGDDTRMVDAATMRDLVPGIGPDVVGGSVSSLDGDCHSLALYRGLYESAQRAGATLVPRAQVSAIRREGTVYALAAEGMVARAPRILIAAGLGTNPLARSVGLPNVVLPQRGQILVTERVAPNLLGSAVASAVRQTPEGTVLIGDTKEDVGMDDRSSPSAMATLARRALRLFPALGRVRVVRSWGGLRVLTPDGDPVYDESPTHPGIFVATTHSGVTLAPAHRGPMVRWILGEARPAEFQSFTASRFPASSFEESTP